MKSKDLLREFYYHAEQDANNDFQLGAMNSAYEQIANDLDLLEAILKHIIVFPNGSLAFKNLSSKRNAELFDLIKEKKENG